MEVVSHSVKKLIILGLSVLAIGGGRSAWSQALTPRARENAFLQQKPTNPAPILPPQLKLNWGRALLWSFEFIDFSDMLVHIAAGRSQPDPWLLYDNDAESKRKSLINRWIEATELPRQKSLSSELLAIAPVMSAGTQTAFREFPIDFVGGDQELNLDGYGWAPVTVEIARNLIHYPFTPNERPSITPSERTNRTESQIRLLEVQVRKTPQFPCRENPKSMCLVQYSYPSAANFRRLEALLKRRNPKLLSALIEAEKRHLLDYDKREFKRAVNLSGHDFGKVRSMNLVSPEFMRLNAALIQELVSWVQDLNLPTAAKYQLLVAIHPFANFNGRSLRMWYRRTEQRPLFMTDFYCDLYCSRAKFAEAVSAGNKQYDHIAATLFQLSKNDPGHNQYRHYYGHQAYFEAAAQTISIKNNQLNNFQRMARDFFTDTANTSRIRRKENQDVFAEFLMLSRPFIPY